MANRSKFTSKEFGPTKPAICEEQDLPPGVLGPGPGDTNTLSFLVLIESSMPHGDMFPGSCMMIGNGWGSWSVGRARFGAYEIKWEFTAPPPDYITDVKFTLLKNGLYANAGARIDITPRSVNPYDTGVITFGDPTPAGQQMCRIVARA
jgi:hypothetical protein